MDKIKVEICCGTACYLLGAANLMSIEDEIPAEFRDKVEVEARTCLELCEKENLGGAPYVRFNGEEIMAQATNEKVLAKPAFSLSSFTFIKRLFSSSSLSAIRVVSSAYLSLLIFLPAILIPACASCSPAFLMMYSA